MISMEILRNSLKELFGIEDKYLIPLNEGWFVPTVDKDEKVGTWIGYRINSIRPYTRAYVSSKTFVKPIQCRFRLTFVGPQAEELASQTLFWEDRDDVKDIMEKNGIQINYNEREIYTYPVKNQGFNDMLAWIVDFTVQTTYEADTNWKPWRKVIG